MLSPLNAFILLVNLFLCKNIYGYYSLTIFYTRKNMISLDSSSENIDDTIRIFLVMDYIYECFKGYMLKVPIRTSMLSGKMYILKCLAKISIACFNNFFMKPDVFITYMIG